ncbi:MAG: hypothetical protein MUO72_02690 [Bacteroidales bacterium]|nr:hypothetical protein [Bacteroidales bacterium]
MKKNAILCILVSFLLLNGCGLVSRLKDLTQTANNLLENINSIVQQIDTKVETGELSREVGNLIDERLDKLAEVIETTIQNSGGFLFDEVNGTVDNAFRNISQLLDQIKTGILDESLPMLMNQLSSEIQENINLISSSVEDIIVLTFGNVFVLVDKTVNSAVIICSIILLAIGLIIFIFLLFRKKRTLTLLRGIGLSFMVIYLAFFLTIIFSNRIRGNIIAGFNLGIKYEGTEVLPKVTSVYPETFTFGTNDKIFLYGKHLNKIDTLKVVLKIGDQVKYNFPPENIIVKSQNRIVLGNFKTWGPPVFAEFSKFMGVSGQAIVNSAQYKRFAKSVNEKMHPQVTYPQVIMHPINIEPVAHTAIPQNIAVHANISEIQNAKKDIAVREFGVAQSEFLLGRINDFFTTRYQLPEGDYGIVALDNKTEIVSPQLLTIVYPVPPAPLPDIFPMEISWTEPYAVAGRSTSLNVKLGFSHPEEIKNDFKIQITSSPALAPIDINVPVGVVASAISSNVAVVTSRTFTVQNPGNYTFTVNVDINRSVTEENEGNQIYSATLPVKRYVYDLNVIYSTFESKSNKDDWPYETDEYRIKIRTSVTANGSWEFNFNKDGEPGNIYNINQSKNYVNLIPGYLYSFYTTGYEADDGTKDGDDYMGEASNSHYLSTDIKDQDLVQYPLLLETNDYKITGQYTITRRIQ